MRRIKKLFLRKKKNNEDNIVNEVNTFYDNGFLNINSKDKIKFSKEETFAENRKSINNEDEKQMENKDNNVDNNNNNLQERINETESIVLESESESPGS